MTTGLSAQEPALVKQKKQKPKLGVNYFLSYQNEFTHHVGLMLALKRVQFTAGCAMQRTDKINDITIGYPFGAFINVHYACGKPKAAFKFTFDCLFDHLNSQSVGWLDWGTRPYTNQPIIYIFRNNDFKGSIGPGFQLCLIEGCTVRFGLLFQLYKYQHHRVTTKSEYGDEITNSFTFQQFLLPGDRGTLNLKLGVNYVFQY